MHDRLELQYKLSTLLLLFYYTGNIANHCKKPSQLPHKWLGSSCNICTTQTSTCIWHQHWQTSTSNEANVPISTTSVWAQYITI